MDRRITRILVLGFACLWFGMLVPVHQRGQIRLPGPAAVAADGSPEMAAVAHCPRGGGADAACAGKSRQQPAPGEQPPRDNSGGGCAVCHFIAGLDAPPPVTLRVAALGFLRALPAEQPLAAPDRHTALPFHGLDPPLA